MSERPKVRGSVLDLIGDTPTVELRSEDAIRQTTKVAPNKKSAATYDKSFRTYDKLYGDLKERFAEMAAL